MCEEKQELKAGILDDGKFDDYYNGPRKALRHIISDQETYGCIQPDIMEFYASEADLGKRIQFIKKIYGVGNREIHAGFIFLRIATSDRGMRIIEYGMRPVPDFDLTVSWRKVAVCIQEAISNSDYYWPKG